MENTKRRGDGSSPCLQGKSTMESILASRGMITPQKESHPNESLDLMNTIE
jgi:hypothetical protein